MLLTRSPANVTTASRGLRLVSGLSPKSYEVIVCVSLSLSCFPLLSTVCVTLTCVCLVLRAPKCYLDSPANVRDFASRGLGSEDVVCLRESYGGCVIYIYIKQTIYTLLSTLCVYCDMC
jgi:hypothetical protein